MKGVCSSASARLVMVVLVASLFCSEVKLVAEAVTCNPLQLSPCAEAITSGAPPSGACCSKLREQRPCLCGYLRDPNLRQFVNSPNAKKVVAACGVPTPRC